MKITVLALIFASSVLCDQQVGKQDDSVKQLDDSIGLAQWLEDTQGLPKQMVDSVLKNDLPVESSDDSGNLQKREDVSKQDTPKQLDENADLAQWLEDSQGLPKEMVDNVLKNDAPETYDDKELQKREEAVKKEDQQVQEESSSEENALESEDYQQQNAEKEDDTQQQEAQKEDETSKQDTEAQDIAKESVNLLKKRGISVGFGSGCGNKCGCGCGLGPRFTHRRTVVDHWTCFRRFRARVFVAPLISRCGCLRRRIGTVIIVKRGCRIDIFVKRTTVIPVVVKTIPFCIKKNRCGKLNRFGYGVCLGNFGGFHGTTFNHGGFFNPKWLTLKGGFNGGCGCGY